MIGPNQNEQPLLTRNSMVSIYSSDSDGIKKPLLAIGLGVASMMSLALPTVIIKCKKDCSEAVYITCGIVSTVGLTIIFGALAYGIKTCINHCKYEPL